MATNPVARRYAKALLDLGVEQSTYSLYREQLEALAQAYETSRDFRNTMLNPSIKLEERKEIMRKIAAKFGFDAMIRNFTLLLLDKDRFRLVSEISREYTRQANEKDGRLHAHVTSAKALTPLQLSRLTQTLAKLTGKKIELESEVDPELIGGTVTRLGGVVLDGSVRSSLESMRASILQEI